MKIVGGDRHARQQSIAMVDTETGEFTEKTVSHEGNAAREFCAALEGPVVVGIEATGAMQWFLELLEEFARSRTRETLVLKLAATGWLFAYIALRLLAQFLGRTKASQLQTTA